MFCYLFCNLNKKKTAITDTKLYVPVATLSTNENAELLQQSKTSFKGTITWIRYQSKATIKKTKSVFRLLKWSYDYFYSILRLFGVLPNFLFTTSEAMLDYYLWTWYIWVASRVAKGLKSYDLRKLGNIRNVSKLQRMIA